MKNTIQETVDGLWYQLRPGDTVSIEVERDGELIVDATLVVEVDTTLSVEEDDR